jgi:uncharacterized protein YlxW (UPF0749 family)
VTPQEEQPNKPSAGGRPASAAGDTSAPRQYVGLLTQITDNTLDEDYRQVAEARTSTDSARGGLAGIGVVLVLFGLLIGVSAVSTRQDQPRLEAERDELIDQIQSHEARLDEIESSSADLRDQIRILQDSVAEEIENSGALQARLEALGVSAGTLEVRGPGMTITVDDAPDSDGSTGGVIRDQDLQKLVNGLWVAGAEAVAIDGHRLTSLTAIRFAGEAITVDYRSLTPPYVVDAIGDPSTLPARFTQSDGGQLWLSLEANFGIRFDSETKDSIVIPADPHEHLNYATRGDR